MGRGRSLRTAWCKEAVWRRGVGEEGGRVAGHRQDCPWGSVGRILRSSFWEPLAATVTVTAWGR